MDLDRLRRNWDQLAETDPWRAILGRPGEGPDWTIEQFFESGRWEIREVMRYAKALDLPAGRHAALDFGCGAGRLTQPLARHFDQVTGVDVSPAMLELAREHNQYPERCHYVLNEAPDLRQFQDASFDLVYSNITLQHLRPRLAQAYVVEFLRVLAPQGLLLFHLPSHRLRPCLARVLPGNLYSVCGWVAKRFMPPRTPVIEMHGIRRGKMVRFLEQHGGRVLAHQFRDSAGSEWATYRYVVTR